MSRTRDALEFVGAIMPSLIELGRDLFARHNGDTSEAAKELHRIRNHGARFDAAESAMLLDLEDEPTPLRPKRP